MKGSGFRATGLVVLSLALGAPMLSAQKIEATVLYRQNSDDNYAALIPNEAGVLPDGVVDCAAEIASEACSGAQSSLPGQPALNVTGTTLSLLLPDGKVAVVNCLNKYSSRGTFIVRRSCAMPMVQHVEADFDGQRAKLKWPVGPDGRKTESETYKIVALLNKH
ncbi:MAG TPA: hypothetical protein VL967_06970 [Terracidiphilus sp.]|nr:hypothetical protein [Terracidiphilus sp.]